MGSTPYRKARGFACALKSAGGVHRDLRQVAQTLKISLRKWQRRYQVRTCSSLSRQETASQTALKKDASKDKNVVFRSGERLMHSQYVCRGAAIRRKKIVFAQKS